ncbi:hypothetical protein D2T81_16715 [Azospirillum brasilense]|nr:hypothetical protein D2T81_16715 [Azospirillum brasilense]
MLQASLDQSLHQLGHPQADLVPPFRSVQKDQQIEGWNAEPGPSPMPPANQQIEDMLANEAMSDVVRIEKE